MRLGSSIDQQHREVPQGGNKASTPFQPPPRSAAYPSFPALFYLCVGMETHQVLSSCRGEFSEQYFGGSIRTYGKFFLGEQDLGDRSAQSLLAMSLSPISIVSLPMNF